jgi:hypothetical protein
MTSRCSRAKACAGASHGSGGRRAFTPTPPAASSRLPAGRRTGAGGPPRGRLPRTWAATTLTARQAGQAGPRRAGIRCSARRASPGAPPPGRTETLGPRPPFAFGDKDVAVAVADEDVRLARAVEGLCLPGTLVVRVQHGQDWSRRVSSSLSALAPGVRSMACPHRTDDGERVLVEVGQKDWFWSGGRRACAWLRGRPERRFGLGTT